MQILSSYAWFCTSFLYKEIVKNAEERNDSMKPCTTVSSIDFFFGKDANASRHCVHVLPNVSSAPGEKNASQRCARSAARMGQLHSLSDAALLFAAGHSALSSASPLSPAHPLQALGHLVRSPWLVFSLVPFRIPFFVPFSLGTLATAGSTSA